MWRSHVANHFRLPIEIEKIWKTTKPWWKIYRQRIGDNRPLHHNGIPPNKIFPSMLTHIRKPLLIPRLLPNFGIQAGNFSSLPLQTIDTLLSTNHKVAGFTFKKKIEILSQLRSTFSLIAKRKSTIHLVHMLSRNEKKCFTFIFKHLLNQYRKEELVSNYI